MRSSIKDSVTAHERLRFKPSNLEIIQGFIMEYIGLAEMIAIMLFITFLYWR